jgi:hypothetical protein
VVPAAIQTVPPSKARVATKATLLALGIPNILYLLR